MANKSDDGCPGDGQSDDDRGDEMDIEELKAGDISLDAEAATARHQ